MFTTLTHSQADIFGFRWKKNITLYWNLNSLSSFCFLNCCFVSPRLSFGLLLGDWLNHPMLITAVSLLFKVEDKIELQKEVKSQWSALRGFNWQHFNSYIMLQSTDLLCETIFFAKFNLLKIFILHFLANIEGTHTPIWFAIGTRAYCFSP